MINLSGHSVLQNFRTSMFEPLRLFIHSLEAKHKFPYYSNPNKFLSLNELIIALAKLNKQKSGGCYLWSCKRPYIGLEFIP